MKNIKTFEGFKVKMEDDDIDTISDLFFTATDNIFKEISHNGKFDNGFSRSLSEDKRGNLVTVYKNPNRSYLANIDIKYDISKITKLEKDELVSNIDSFTKRIVKFGYNLVPQTYGGSLVIPFTEPKDKSSYTLSGDIKTYHESNFEQQGFFRITIRKM